MQSHIEHIPAEAIVYMRRTGVYGPENYALALVDGDIRRLNILPRKHEQIAALLELLPKKQSVSSLRSAVSSVCSALEIRQPVARQYLRRLGEGLYPRVHTALSTRNLDGVFLSF